MEVVSIPRFYYFYFIIIRPAAILPKKGQQIGGKMCKTNELQQHAENRNNQNIELKNPLSKYKIHIVHKYSYHWPILSKCILISFFKMSEQWLPKAGEGSIHSLPAVKKNIFLCSGDKATDESFNGCP